MSELPNPTNIKSAVRELIAHEDNQIDRRITWLCQLQGFLFASLGFSWEKSHELSEVLAGLGIAVSVLVSIGLFAATLAQRRIRAYWVKVKPSDEEGPDIMGFFPHTAPLTAFTSPENLLPFVLIVGWILVWRAI